MHKKYILILTLLLIVCFLAFSGCEISISTNGNNNPLIGISPPSSNTPRTSGTTHLGKQTKTSGCAAHGGLPDSACTPGAIFPNATPQQICTYGYTRSVRNVPYSEKDQAYAEYGIQYHSPGEFEIDHLVPLELGGSNDSANLWPEAASPTPGFHQKDQVENYLHDQVCAGAMSLKDAQTQIAANWIAVYNRMPK
jgi:hypothetical protein